MKITSCEVKYIGNTPRLLVNSNPVPPILYCLSDIPASKSNTAYAQNNISIFAENGINLVCVDVSMRSCWNKATPNDFSPMTEEILGVTDANPNAAVFVRLHVNPPYWWLRDNPDECIIYRTSKGDEKGIDNGEQLRLIDNDSSHHLRVSFASEKWKDEAGEVLKQLCIAVNNSDAIGNLAGIQIGYGTAGEWHSFGIDVSKPMETHFRRTIKEKYKTEENLKQAYNDENVTFENAVFSPEPWKGGTPGNVMMSFPGDMRYADSRYAHALAGIDAILHFCKIVKENICKKIVVGTFYGYFYGVANTIDGGHCLTRELFNKHIVDYVAAPAPYSYNRLPNGPTVQRGVLETCRLNRVLWLTEMDQRPFGTEYIEGGDMSLLGRSIAQMRRNMLQPLLAGHGAWYYDHRIIQLKIENGEKNISFGGIHRKFGWWEKQCYRDDIKKLYNLINDRLNIPYTHPADVLLVVDNNKYFYSRPYRHTELDFIFKIATCGVAYDTIFIDDLDLCDLSRYKCIFFQNTTYISQKNREIIASKIKPQQTAVFTWLSGYTDGCTSEISNTESLIGIKTEIKDNISAVKFENSVFDDMQTGCIPAIKIVSGETPVAYYADGDVAGVQKGNLLYYACPNLSKEEVLRIIKQSGAFIYGEKLASVFAGMGLIAANNGEETDIHIVLNNGKHIDLSCPPYTTAVFDIESGLRYL